VIEFLFKISSEANCYSNMDSMKLCEDYIKLQPMVRKSRKQLTPEEQKDSRYWDKRAKNNFAAKRSRETRRMRENQIVLRANYLEKENVALKKVLKKLKEENDELKKILNQ
jgi:leukemia factor-related protein